MEGKHLSFAFLAATQVIPGIGNDVTTQGGPEKPILKWPSVSKQNGTSPYENGMF